MPGLFSPFSLSFPKFTNTTIRAIPYGLVLSSFPNNKSNRSSSKAKIFSNLVLNISSIGKMHQFPIVDKDYKGRRRYGSLGNIEKL